MEGGSVLPWEQRMVTFTTQAENAMAVLTLLHSHSTEAGPEVALADSGMTQTVAGMGNSRCILHFAAH